MVAYRKGKHTTYPIGPVSFPRMRSIWEPGGAGRTALREELKTYPYGGSGLEYNILFAKAGYTPHYAEHVIDPIDGREKLVMFDPHTRKSAFIYDLKTREIEWEFIVPGTARANPHQGGMLLEDVPNFGDAGDIYCTDKDNNIIVVDRETKQIKFSKTPPFTPSFLHCVKLGRDKQSLIVTDYDLPRISKLRLPDLTEMWSITTIYVPSKISIIEGKEFSHTPSFGGDYLIPSNTVSRGTIYELRDSDGSIAWQAPSADGRGPWICTPHSAFRMGRIEYLGNITVVGSEGGGGIYAIDRFGRVVWCVSGTAVDASVELDRLLYSVNTRGLGEVTHVFPTLNGRIGFISWSGFNSSIVGEITRLPQRQESTYILAANKTSTDDWEYLEPAIRAEEWDETVIIVKNTGANPLTWKVDAYPAPYAALHDPTHYLWGRVPLVPQVSVPGGETDSVSIEKRSTWLNVAVKSAVPGSSTRYTILVLQRRG